MSRQQFYADGNRVFCKPQKTKKGTKLGFVVCTVPVTAEDNAKEIARRLNGAKPRRIIKSLLKAFDEGSPLEEKFLDEILAAEQYLKDGK